MKLYRAFPDYLKQRFGEKVHKVSLDADFTCPNRDGAKATGGCIYCNNDSFNFSPAAPLKVQLAAGIERVRKRFGANKVFAYFQAYTNTYASPGKLYDTYSTIFDFPEVVGLSIGTRPDCVPEDVLRVVQSFTATHEVWLEYGLESSQDETLRRINRAHTFADFKDAVLRTQGRGIKVAAHIITGFPWETADQMLQTGRDVASLPLDAVKIHNLHIVRGTALERIHAKTPFVLQTLEAYAATVAGILEHLPPEMIILRLAAECPADLLVAPTWTNRKSEIVEAIVRELQSRNSFQGKLLLSVKGASDSSKPA